MAWNQESKTSTPERDASLGLIFRLNDLWAQADRVAIAAEYGKWGTVLDRIYCNLLYSEDPIIIMDEQTNKIKNVKLGDKDTKVYQFLSRKIFFWKVKEKKAKTSLTKTIAMNHMYQAMQLKDIWLRKLMKRLGLYLKEVEHRPGTAFFGNLGKKK